MIPSFVDNFEREFYYLQGSLISNFKGVIVNSLSKSNQSSLRDSNGIRTHNHLVRK